MKRLLVIFLIILTMSGMAFAGEVEMDKYKVVWGLGADYNFSQEEHLFKGENELEVAHDKEYIFTERGELNLEIPVNFFLGQAGYIHFDTFNSKNAFVRIIYDDENLEIESITRIFKHFRAFKFENKNEVITEKYELLEKVDTSKNIIEYRHGDEVTAQGYFLLLPQEIGKSSITIEVGEGEEVYDTKTIEFEVKEPSNNILYSYDIEAEVEGVIYRGLINHNKSVEQNQVIYIEKSEEVGKINGEFYFEFNGVGEVEIEQTGKINVLDETGFLTLDKDFNLIKNKIAMKNPLEESSVEIITVMPEMKEINNNKLFYGGELSPEIKFKNTVDSVGGTLPISIPTDTPANTPTGNPKRSPIVPLVLLSIVSLAPLIVLSQRLRISLIEVGTDRKSVYVNRKGGGNKDINVVVKTNKEDISFPLTIKPKGSVELIPDNNFEILELIIVDENIVNHSSKTKIERWAYEYEKVKK